MKNHPRLRTVTSLVLVCIQLACSSIRPTPEPRPEELHEYVLVIQETPGGQTEHSWRPAAEFQEVLKSLPSFSSTSDQTGQIVLASHRSRDCDQEHIDCHRLCMRRKLPPPLNYIPRGHPTHNEICRKQCLSQYNDCLKLQGLAAVQFPAVNSAVEWLKHHQTELLVGTLIVIAGVTFAVASAGAGLVLLAPLALVAS